MTKSACLKFVGMLCVLCLAAAPATAPSRHDIPAADAQASVEKLLHELYAKQYADHAPAARRKLATLLLQQVDNTRHDPTARFVLLSESVKSAAQANDAPLAMRALTRLGRDYTVNDLELKESTLRTIVRTMTTPRQAQEAADQCMILADQAILDQDHPTAERLLGLAQAAANKSAQVETALKVRDRKKELAAFQREQSAYEAATTKLNAGQADAADRLCVGRMRCFILNDWTTGLPLLAQSDDPALSKAADLEATARPDDPLACVAAANAWWDQAPNQGRLQSQSIRRHAAQWYRRARPGLSGVNLDIADKRLSEVPLLPADVARLQPGLTTDIFSGQNFDHFLIRRIDPQINFNWGKAPIGPTLPKEDFSLRWRGYLLTDREGTYTFVLLANRGGRLIIDGQTLLDADNLSHKRKGVRAQVKLSAGAHAFRAETWNGSGMAKAIVQWIAPGEVEPAPIPPEAFKRE